MTDEIIDNMAQGRKALGLIYSGDATYVMAENEDMGYFMPETGTNLWSDAMVIPKNAKNPDLAHAFINYASAITTGPMIIPVMWDIPLPIRRLWIHCPERAAIMKGSMLTSRGTDNKNDEVFVYNENTKKIISDLWSRVKIAASNAE